MHDKGLTYTNPVYPHCAPDPFVLKWCDHYWAYASGREDTRAFPICHSSDLVHWEPAGHALDPIPLDVSEYWAPEAAGWDGHFYLYYGVGNEETMAIRVAVADTPAGPFVDSGTVLTGEPFAIDAHVFRDRDGERYLFYATDFLDHSHIGTGTMMDRMIDPFTLAGKPRPVARAQYDWQVYDPQRQTKGGVRWHTVEGPFVLERKGRYYEIFSGGNWTDASYGVAYATSETLQTDDEWHQPVDGHGVLPVLRTVPGHVVGPGHNSVIRGPDNRQLFCVYHEWVGDERVMAIDRLDWAGNRLFVLGPTDTPQPAPLLPRFRGFDLRHGWEVRDDAWTVDGTSCTVEHRAEPALLRLPVEHPAFLAEVSIEVMGTQGEAGVALYAGGDCVLRLALTAHDAGALLTWCDATGDWHEYRTGGYAPWAIHCLRLDTGGGTLRAAIDGLPLGYDVPLAAPATALALEAHCLPARYTGFALTVGWEHLFDTEQSIEALGWTGWGDWHVTGGCHEQRDVDAPHTMLTRGPALNDYQLVVNLQLLRGGPESAYGILPAVQGDNDVPAIAIEQAETGWVMIARGTHEQQWPLPTGFDPHAVNHFRLTRGGNRIDLALEGTHLGEIESPAGPATVGLFTRYASIAVEAIRVTEIPEDREQPGG